MAIPQYTTTELIESIKRRCNVPTSQILYTNTDFCLMASDEIQGVLVPLIMSLREEYFLKYEDVAIPATGIIDFPLDCVGTKLRSVCVLRTTSPLHLENLPRIDLDVIAGIGTATLKPGFFIQDNTIRIFPTNSQLGSATLRIYYFRRSLQLAIPGNYGKITAIDSITNTITLSRVPATWAANTQLNAISSIPNFALTNELFTIVSVSSPTVVVSSVTGLVVGDYVSEYGYTAIPQLPLEAHAFLAQLTAAKVLEGLGDRSGMEAAYQKAEQLKTGLLTIASQRVDGSVKKVVNPNGGLRINSGFTRNRR